MRRSTVQNSAATDSPPVLVLGNDTETAYSMRSGLLFTQAAIVLLTGFLLPIPPVVIDILLAVNIIFTAMLLFVAFAAREPADLTSLPPVVVIVTLLRLGTNVVAVKSILLIANGGYIINWCGIRIYYGFISIAIAVLLVFLICVVICKAAIFIRRKAVSYLVETIPNRQATLDDEFQNGTLSYDQMLRVKKHIERQTKFFAGMASTSSLLLCDSVIALIIATATLFGTAILGFMDDSRQYLPLALAIAMTTATPAAFIALALRVLINKRFLLTLKVQSPIAKTILTDKPAETAPFENDTAETAAIEAPAMEVAEQWAPNEMPSPTITEYADQRPFPQQEFDDFITENIISDEILPEQTTVAEAQVEIETEREKIQSIGLPPEELPDMPLPAVTDELEDESQPAYQQPRPLAVEEVEEIEERHAPPQIVRDDYYYDSILATIGDKNKATLLLAGESVSQLPITIAVELAIRIIQFGKKCLLMDMDPSRNAAAMAFDIDSASMQGKAVPTGIQNLWVSPADNSESPSAIKLSRKVANALQVFDYVIIYVPNATEENVQNQLSGIPDAAVIFGVNQEAANLEPFSKILLLWGCRTFFEQDVLKKIPENTD